MRPLLLLPAIFLLLALPAPGQEFLRRGEVTRSYQLVLDGQTPYVMVTLANQGKRHVLVEVPAGVPLLGQREPCLPVVLGRPIAQRLAPGARVSVKVEALSLSLYPHHPGPYEVPPPPAYEDEYVRVARTVSRIWARATQGGLQSDPVRLSQWAAFLLSGQVPDAEAEVRRRASDGEWRELQAFLR